MNVSWEAGSFGLLFESNEYGFRLRSSVAPSQPVQAHWDEVFAAGLIRLKRRTRAPARYPMQLLLAAVGPQRKPVYIKIPSEGPEREAILAEFQTNLGDRWLGDGFTQFQLRRKLELANWWIVPATCGFTLLIAVLLLGAIGVFALAMGVAENYIASPWLVFGVLVLIAVSTAITRFIQRQP